MALLTREMEAVVERLRVAFDPEEIVVFGSRAYGRPRPESDVDLLVILRSAGDGEDERRRRAAGALWVSEARHVDGHVFAYTAGELLDLLRRGDTAIRDALAKGERLYPEGGCSRYAELAEEWSPVEASRQLIEKARDDLDVAELILSSTAGRRPWWAAAFHAQQSAEKALKALIYRLGGEPERSHDLTELALAAAGLDPAGGRQLLLTHQARLAELGRFAVQPRYTASVSEAEARSAVETAQALLHDVAAALDA